MDQVNDTCPLRENTVSPHSKHSVITRISVSRRNFAHHSACFPLKCADIIFRLGYMSDYFKSYM